MCDYRRGFHWWIDLLTIYKSSLQITIAIFTLYSSLEHTVQYYQSVIRRFLVTVRTMAIPLPLPQVLPSRTPVPNWLKWPCPLLITSRHGPHRKHSYVIVAFVSVTAETYLPSRCPETALVYLSFSRSLHSNGCTGHNRLYFCERICVNGLWFTLRRSQYLVM
jgi:hypothetical protein